MRYSTKYTVRKLFSKPYFSHPFEIIPINQEDINEKIHTFISNQTKLETGYLESTLTIVNHSQ